MTMRASDAAKNAACNALVDLIDVGGTGTMEIWTGAQPGSIGGSESGNTLLGTLTFSATAFGNAGAVGPNGSGTQPATPGRAYAAAITSDTNADSSGTAGHCLIKSGAGTVLFDGTCGQGTGDANFDVNVIVSGGTIACPAMYIGV